MSAQISQEFLAALAAATPDRIAAAMRVLTGELAIESLAEGPLLMTVTDAARRLGVARSTVARAIRAKRLTKVELYQGSYRLRRADVEAIAAPRK